MSQARRAPGTGGSRLRRSAYPPHLPRGLELNRYGLVSLFHDPFFHGCSNQPVTWSRWLEATLEGRKGKTAGHCTALHWPGPKARQVLQGRAGQAKVGGRCPKGVRDYLSEIVCAARQSGQVNPWPLPPPPKPFSDTRSKETLEHSNGHSITGSSTSTTHGRRTLRPFLTFTNPRCHLSMLRCDLKRGAHHFGGGTPARHGAQGPGQQSWSQVSLQQISETLISTASTSNPSCFHRPSKPSYLLHTLRPEALRSASRWILE